MPLITDKAQIRIMINGVETALGKNVSTFLNTEGYTVYAPTLAELDISNIEELAFYNNSQQDTTLIVINCENHYDSSKYTETEFVDRYKNLVTYGLWNGAKFIHFSTDQVFDGQSAYLKTDARNPLTSLGSVHAQVEEFIASGYAADNNFLILRTSWLHSYDETTTSDFELNLAKQIKTLAEGQSTLDVPSNIQGRPSIVEHLVPEAMRLVFEDHYGVQHLGSRDVCSLSDFASDILSGSGVVVNSFAVSGSGFITDNPIIGDHNIDNVGVTLEYPAHTNLVGWASQSACFKLKSLGGIPSFYDLLYPMEDFMHVDFQNAPDKKQWLLDIATAGTVLSYFDNQSDYDRDLAIVDYMFPAV